MGRVSTSCVGRRSSRARRCSCSGGDSAATRRDGVAHLHRVADPGRDLRGPLVCKRARESPGPNSRTTTAPAPRPSARWTSSARPTGPSPHIHSGWTARPRRSRPRHLRRSDLAGGRVHSPPVIAVLIGVHCGTIAGYFRGWVDSLLSRFMDVVLAFPVLLFAIGLASACALGKGCLGGLITPGPVTLIVVIALASWPYLGADHPRAGAVDPREGVHRGGAVVGRVEHSGSCGARSLPNLVAPIIVYTSLILPTNILFEAALSFLGVGVQPPTASWGQMIADASPNFNTAWWYMVFPGRAPRVDRARVQPGWRRPAGCVEPEGGTLTESSGSIRR